MVRQQLAGKIWIADFIFTKCPGPCPIISTRMSELQKPLEKSDAHLVSFSVDPENDTPAGLAHLCGKTERAAGPLGFSYRLARSDLFAFKGWIQARGIGWKRRGRGPVHSTRFVLVDRRGTIRGYYDALTPDAVTKLLADTNHLLREQPGRIPLRELRLTLRLGTIRGRTLTRKRAPDTLGIRLWATGR